MDKNVKYKNTRKSHETLARSKLVIWYTVVCSIIVSYNSTPSMTTTTTTVSTRVCIYFCHSPTVNSDNAFHALLFFFPFPRRAEKTTNNNSPWRKRKKRARYTSNWLSWCWRAGRTNKTTTTNTGYPKTPTYYHTTHHAHLLFCVLDVRKPSLHGI